MALGVTLHKRFAIFLRGNNTIAKLFSTRYWSHLDYHNLSFFLSFFLCFVATRKEVTNTEREPAKRWLSWPNHETQQHQLLENEDNRIFFSILLVYCLVFLQCFAPMPRWWSWWTWWWCQSGWGAISHAMAKMSFTNEF